MLFYPLDWLHHWVIFPKNMGFRIWRIPMVKD
jgi:hypothetical protein